MKNVFLGIIVMLCLGLSLSVTMAQEDELTREEIDRIATTVVYIEVLDRRGDPLASGSGTLVTSTGLIYTNSHVITDGEDFHIFVMEDLRELPVPRYYASIVRVFDEIDFAILQIDRDEDGDEIDPESLNLPFLDQTSSDVGHGEDIHIFGYPDIGDGFLVVTRGTITTIEQDELNGERIPIWYRTDAEMSSGNSGGLVVNVAGQFIGIPTWVRKAESTLGQLGGILPYPAIEVMLQTPPDDDPRVDPDDNNSGEAIEVTLVNDSNTTICYVFISPETSTEWGDDLLGRNDTLASGEEWTGEFFTGVYDIMLLDCDRETLVEQYGLDFDDSITLTFPDDFNADAPRRDDDDPEPRDQGDEIELTIINDSNDDICSIQISLSTETEWGDNLLGRDELREGDEFNDNFEEGVYDFRFLDCDDDVLLEQYRISLDEDLTLVYPDDFE
ncbi:MAG: serine protease [Anaerolineae bacterium]|nr:serine protease [Anaerolineae bacterium]